MTARTAGIGLVALAALALLAFVPRLGNAYYLALAISLLQYTVLATAWGMFSGPDALRLAGNDRLLRRRRLYRRRARRDIALAAGAADRGGARRDRGAPSSGSRRCA